MHAAGAPQSRAGTTHDATSGRLAREVTVGSRMIRTSEQPQRTRSGARWRPQPAGGVAPSYGPTPPSYGQPPPSGTPPQGWYGPPYAPVPPRTDDAVWGVLAHLSIFVFALIAPLIIYLVFKDSSPFARHHAAEALNFPLTLLIALLVSVPLTFLLIGIPMLLATMICGVVFGILAAVAAGRRESYRYPLTIHFVT